jgi:hypothetical protein
VISHSGVPRVADGGAIDRARELGIEPRNDGKEPRIERREEHARLERRLAGLVVVDEAVGEDAVVYEIVGDGHIEGLVELIQPLLRPGQNGGGQNGEDDKRQPGPGEQICARRMSFHFRNLGFVHFDVIAAPSEGPQHNGLARISQGLAALRNFVSAQDRMGSSTTFSVQAPSLTHGPSSAEVDANSPLPLAR